MNLKLVGQSLPLSVQQEHTLNQIPKEITRQPNENLLPKPDTILKSSKYYVAVHICEKTLQVEADDLLETFWTERLDTPCMVCCRPFNDRSQPPIRTISLGGISSFIADGEDTFAISRVIRIHNRHMNCIKSRGLKYIPISHAWHQAVADAHETRKANPEATDLVMALPFNILIALTTHFGKTTEIWHDYISIPQWHYKCQQSLLLMLPALFEHPDFSVVHFEDVSTTHIHRVAASRWFKRMWVVLEYGRSKDVRILTKEYSLWPESLPEVIQALGREMTHSISVITKSRGFDSEKFKRLTVGASWCHQVAARTNTAKTSPILGPYKSFGAVIQQMWRLKCRNHRDRWIAMCGFIFPDRYSIICSGIPSNPTEACLFVAKMCLLNWDYTPLLLTHTDEDSLPNCRWLVGHQRISHWTWKFGIPTSTSSSSILVQERSIVLNLEPIGTVCAIENLFLEHNTNVKSLLIRASKTIVNNFGASPVEYIVVLEQLFAVPPSLSGSSNPLTFLGFEQRDPQLATKLVSILQKLLHIPDWEVREGSSLVGKTVEDLIRLLELDNQYADNEGFTFDRLSNAVDKILFDILLALIKCGSCEKRSMFRVDMWEEFNEGMRLFRIPDLGYQGSFTNGVGLVIWENRIVGRMMYGRPSCECHFRELVEVW